MKPLQSKLDFCRVTIRLMMYGGFALSLEMRFRRLQAVACREGDEAGGQG